MADPLTTAAGAVVTAVGKEAAKKADGYLALLLKPELTVIGKERALRRQEAYDALRATKLESNLVAHATAGKARAAVKRSRKGSPKKPGKDSGDPVPPGFEEGKEPTLEAIDNLKAWSDAVEEIDPENAEVAAVWQEIFASIINGEVVNNLVIPALKALNPQEARELLAFRCQTVAQRHIDPYFASSLLRKGLIFRRVNSLISFSVGVAIILSSTTIISFLLASLITHYNRNDLNFSMTFWLFPITFFLLPLVLMFKLRGTRLHLDIWEYKATWLGSQILKFAPSPASANERR
jgi:hypothetical protein